MMATNRFAFSRERGYQYLRASPFCDARPQNCCLHHFKCLIPARSCYAKLIIDMIDLVCNAVSSKILVHDPHAVRSYNYSAMNPPHLGVPLFSQVSLWVCLAKRCLAKQSIHQMVGRATGIGLQTLKNTGK